MGKALQFSKLNGRKAVRVVLYNVQERSSVFRLQMSRFDLEEVAELTFAGWPGIFLQDRLCIVWQWATTSDFWYSLTSVVERTACWYCISISWRLQGRRSRYGWITSLRKSWIGITMNTLCVLCHPHSLVCVRSTMVATVPWRRPWRWNVRMRNGQRNNLDRTRNGFQLDQPSFSLTEFWPSKLYET